MSEGTVTNKPKTPSSARMIATLGLVSMMSGVLIVFVAKGTEAGIKQNRLDFLHQAIFKVLPEAESSTTFVIQDNGFVPLAEGEQTDKDKVYAGYANGQLTGVAIEASGQGYQDVIRVLFGYDPVNQTIVGFTVLESKETPGLGDRIGKDPDFLANFDKLDVELGAENGKLAHQIAFVKNGEKTEPWQVEGISGATISSRAVANMLDERTAQILPFVHDHLSELKEGK